MCAEDLEALEHFFVKYDRPILAQGTTSGYRAQSVSEKVKLQTQQIIVIVYNYELSPERFVTMFLLLLFPPSLTLSISLSLSLTLSVCLSICLFLSLSLSVSESREIWLKVQTTLT